ncbi:MAG: LamG-like jellyroll fold domain-containing protein [Planctomycetota bacterium]
MHTSRTLIHAAVGLSQLVGASLVAQGPGVPSVSGGGSFEVARAVELQADEGLVHFTTDGSMPTLQSPVSSGTVVLIDSAVVRARVEVDGELGPVRSTQVVRVDDHWLGYDFEDNGQFLTDSSGANREGLLVGSNCVPEGWMSDALLLSGGTARAELGTFNLPSQSVTFSTWINARSFAINDARIISKASGVQEEDHNFMVSTIGVDGQTRLRFRLRTNGDTETLIASSGNLSRNTWHHVAARYDGSRMELFLDGQLVGSMPKTGPIASSNQQIWLGNNAPEANRGFDGYLDQLFMFDRPLQDFEILALASDYQRAGTAELGHGSPTCDGEIDLELLHSVTLDHDTFTLVGGNAPASQLGALLVSRPGSLTFLDAQLYIDLGLYAQYPLFTSHDGMFLATFNGMSALQGFEYSAQAVFLNPDSCPTVTRAVSSNGVAFALVEPMAAPIGGANGGSTSGGDSGGSTGGGSGTSGGSTTNGGSGDTSGSGTNGGSSTNGGSDTGDGSSGSSGGSTTNPPSGGGATQPPPVMDVSVDVLPADRRTVWNPGIYGGVPPDNADPQTFPNGIGPVAQFGPTLNPGGGDDRGQIQAALNGAATNASKQSRFVVQLGPGRFNIGGTLNIPSYVILRGTLDGTSRQTVLNQTFTGTLVSLSGGSNSTWGAVVPTAGTQFKGASEITVSDASGINVGDIIAIDHRSDGTQWGPSDGSFENNSPVETNKFVAWVSSLWYQRQPYSVGSGVQGLFPDSNGWRHISQRCEVLAKNGNTLTIYDPDAEVTGSPLHVTFYDEPEVYRASGVADVRRYAGLESLRIDPNGTNGQRVVLLQSAYCCWVKNIEIDGSANRWSGRHIQLYGHTYRCEIRDSYFHESSNYNQGANAYGIVVGGSENLVENNIAIDLNKPIVCENTCGGNVISYNYVDNAVIGSLTNWFHEAAISTHASFCHWDLFEGNQTPNITIDSTHGNNGWEVAFRNWCFGRNSNGHATAYERAISVDGWNWEVTSVGNVLWGPTTGPEVNNLIWEPSMGSNPVFNGPEHVYLLGSNAWDPVSRNKPGADFGDDGMAFEFFHRHLDFDYKTNSQYNNPENPVNVLPPSLYLETRPAFFGNLEWPWINPAGSSHGERVRVLPAKARYDAGDA